MQRDALIDQLAMAQVTDSTLQDREALKAEIEAGAQRGWFLAREEGAEGVTALGIAGDVSGRVTALSVVGPTQRMDKNMASYAEAILAARREFF